MYHAFKHIMFLALIMHLYFHNQFPIMLLHTHSYYTRCGQTSCSSRYSHIHTFHYYASMHLSQSFDTFIKHIPRIHLFIHLCSVNKPYTHLLFNIHSSFTTLHVHMSNLFHSLALQLESNAHTYLHIIIQMCNKHIHLTYACSYLPFFMHGHNHLCTCHPTCSHAIINHFHHVMHARTTYG